MEITAVSINLSEQVGADDSLLWVPVVPDGREGNIVFARTLRSGEAYPNIPVVFEPENGERLQFRSSSIEISIQDIDRHAKPNTTGYATISNTLWTWLTVGSPISVHIFYYLLAAGRRLDGTHIMLMDVKSRVSSLEGGFISKREQAIQAFALAEILVVSLGRAVDLAVGLRTQFSVNTPLPALVSQLSPSIREIRNAFEHIEDRAMGQVRGHPHADAVSVFNQIDFLPNLTMSYANHSINIDNDIIPLLIDIRQYLFDVAVEFAGPAKQIAIPVEFFK